MIDAIWFTGSCEGDVRFWGQNVEHSAGHLESFQ